METTHSGLAAENFEALWNESLLSGMGGSPRPGQTIRAIAWKVDKNFVHANAGLKSELLIPVEEFGDMPVVAGDEFEVCVESVDDGNGASRGSRLKARASACWATLEEAFKNGTLVDGEFGAAVKGGFSARLDAGVRGFVPGSQSGVRVDGGAELVGHKMKFKVMKVDRQRGNVVLSRRAAMEIESGSSPLADLAPGMVIKAQVKSLAEYGAFVDLGGTDALLHVSDMAWRRVKHPSEIVSVGQELSVTVLRVDRERGRVSVGLKQLGDDPWSHASRRFKKGFRIEGEVVALASYGVFVRLEDGVEGLAHVSELDWLDKNADPSALYSVGDRVEVMVLDVDEEKRRIALGVKQCRANPWEEFSRDHQPGSLLDGQVRSVTDFGVFVDLPGGVVGLCKGGKPGDVTKGAPLKVEIASIDVESGRVALRCGEDIGKPLEVQDRSSRSDHSDRQEARARGKAALSSGQDRSSRSGEPEGLSGFGALLKDRLGQKDSARD